MVNFDGADHQHTAQTVVLKGALLLQTIGITAARPTMDIDMLREGKADQATLTALVKDAHRCSALDVLHRCIIHRLAARSADGDRERWL